MATAEHNKETVREFCRVYSDGDWLAFIDELEYPGMVGVNPEFAHETMPGLSFPTRSRRRYGTGSCSTSTSTRNAPASTTRTSASAPRASATRSTS
jgi:hypothetical protein